MNVRLLRAPQHRWSKKRSVAVFLCGSLLALLGAAGVSETAEDANVVPILKERGKRVTGTVREVDGFTVKPNRNAQKVSSSVYTVWYVADDDMPYSARIQSQDLPVDEAEKGYSVDDRIDVVYDPKDPEVARAASTLGTADDMKRDRNIALGVVVIAGLVMLWPIIRAIRCRFEQRSAAEH